MLFLLQLAPVSPKLTVAFADTGECYNSETRDTTPTKLDVGGSFILSCVVPRQPTPELNWFLDNVAVTSGLLLVDRTDLNYTTLELSADDVTKEDAGRYSCVASYLDAIVTVCDVEVTVAGSKTNGEIPRDVSCKVSWNVGELIVIISLSLSVGKANRCSHVTHTGIYLI